MTTSSSNTTRLVLIIAIVFTFFFSAAYTHAATPVTTTCTAVVSAPSITCNLSSNPTPLIGGQSATFTWTSNADTCTGNGFSTAGSANGTSGSITTAPGGIYQLQCTSSNGADPCTQQITASSPSAYIQAVPDRVKAGGSTAVSWSADQISTCTVTRDGTPVWGPTTLVLPNMTLSTTTLSPSPTISKQTTFAIVCDGAAASDTVIVNIVPKFEEF